MKSERDKLEAFTKKVREGTIEREVCNYRGCEQRAEFTAVIVFSNAKGQRIRGVVARHLCPLHQSVATRPGDVLSDGAVPLADGLAATGMARPIVRHLEWVEYSSVEATAFRKAQQELARQGRTIPTILPSKFEKAKRGR